MTYLSQGQIADNASMQTRVAACAAEQKATYPDRVEFAGPDQWMYDTRRTWAASPGWDEAWEYALAVHADDPQPAPPGHLYDPGADQSCITDGMILSQVQLMLLQPEVSPT